MQGRQLVLGDIHGMYNELRLLLGAACYDPSADDLIVLGDYIDRGSHSRSVLEYLMELKARYPARVHLLKGNHEDMFLKTKQEDEVEGAAAILLWFANGGNATLASFDGIVPPEVISFIEAMPFYLETEQYIFVHAGVDPFLPLAEMKTEDLLWSSSHLPHCSGKLVVVGHAICDTVTYLPWAHTLYIDTGACKATMGGNGRLSLVDLTNNIVHWVNTGGFDPGIYTVNELAAERSL